MRRGTIVLFIFGLIALGIIAASSLLQNQPPIEITLAVDPLIEEWARASIGQFNEQAVVVGAGRRVHVNLSVIPDADVWIDNVPWNGSRHPDAWLPSSSASLAYAEERGLPFTSVTPSLAQTVLIWAGFTDRLDVLTEDETIPLDWSLVQQAAEQESWEALGGETGWRYFKLAFNQPSGTLAGLGAVLSAAAEFNETASLTTAELTSSSFRQWMRPVFGAVNFTIGSDIAAITASRGTSVVDVAIAPESQWLRNLNALSQRGQIRFSEPEYLFAFDFPLARWDDTQTPSDVRAAVDALARFLQGAPQQNLLTTYGLRPASRAITQADTLFSQAEALGVPLNRDLEVSDAAVTQPIIQPPTLTDVRTLLAWVSNIR